LTLATDASDGSPCGSRTKSRVRRGSTAAPFLAGRARRHPEHRHAATAADVHERPAVARANADAHDFRVAAQEQQQRALGGLARERALRLAHLVETRDRRRRADEGEVRADLGEPAARGAWRGPRTSCSKLPRAASRSPWRATWIPQRPAALTPTTASSARA
jgi:hypothetical protein